jgi:predicted phosphodiesterase
MKIRLLSDLHGEGYAFKYDRLDEDVVVLAGDINVGAHNVHDYIASTFPDDIPIVYVAGNHEYYKHNFQQTNTELETLFAGTNVHFLNNKSVTINGVRFLGGTMWSDFELFGLQEKWFATKGAARGINDFHIINYTDQQHWHDRAFTTADCEQLHAEWEKWIKHELANGNENEETVIVTHFCPSIQSVHDKWKNSAITPYFTSNKEHLMGRSKLWLHGHTHDSHDYVIADTRVVCNPRGYGSENRGQFNPELIINI